MKRVFTEHSRSPDYYGGTTIYLPQMMRKLKFCDADAWPGFKFSICVHDELPVLSLDVCHLYIRYQSVFDKICEIKKNLPLETKDKLETVIRSSLKNQTIVSRYNNRIYKINDVDF